MSEERSCGKCKIGKVKDGSIDCEYIPSIPVTANGEYARRVASICRHYAEPEPTGFEKAWRDALAANYPGLVPDKTSGALRSLAEIMYASGWADGRRVVIEEVREEWKKLCNWNSLNFHQLGSFSIFLDKLKEGKG